MIFPMSSLYKDDSVNQVLLKKLPKVDMVLARPQLQEACGQWPYTYIKETVQNYLETLRRGILDETIDELPELANMEQSILDKLSAGSLYSLSRVINATGVVLHTNLGRAPLGREVGEHIAQVAGGYSNLEYDVAAGKRGSRYAHLEKLLCELTGAEAAMVVNNNAGAVFLMLNTLAKGKRVAISRGELVEIGGAFRVPEIMEQSGAELVEVGTTNKTRLSDYQRAVAEKGASVLLKVHTSNFVMTGFTEEAELPKLVELGRETESLVLYDAGAAFLFAPELLGIHSGEVLRKCVENGADVVCFSGDKLLGSAQAGILVGKKEYIDRIRKNALTRMLRIDKLSLAALEASLQYYKNPMLAARKVPSLAMMSMTAEACCHTAQRLAEAVRAAAPKLFVSVAAVEDEVGGGSLPGVMLPGYAVRIESGVISADAMEAFLRTRPVPVIGRIQKDGLLLSVRTIFSEDERDIADAFAALQEQLSQEADAE